MHLVLFDFDGTLTRRDSLMPFLRHVCGSARFALGIVAMSPVLAAYASGVMPNDRAKERVLKHFLQGRTPAALARLGQSFADGPLRALLRDDIMQALHRHQEAGDLCVLVSASLDLYLAPWGRSNGFAAVLCSSLHTQADGQVDGTLVGGNCFGPEKLVRVQRWLGDTRPERITAYGDSRGDREILEFADEPHWVGRKSHARTDATPANRSK